MNAKSSKIRLAGVDLSQSARFATISSQCMLQYSALCFSYLKNTMILGRLFIYFNYFCLSPSLTWKSRNILHINH
jgi:hypothetical protein